ncbi:hypothetical protein BS50DRAFT_604785 [Corynespora cassiicola Philippines]|uniref:Uncharacterized protein n=1 Tax=Corynespora cassiicola Philippines TaxID=1448308 RepID=A0A2T2N484_CORCC|nr:hypothetical protein BS50DRAFT_604785 [Corynespora cassiicola Philippines]
METASFNGPWTRSLDELRTSVKNMPDKYRASFDNLSKDTIKTICDPDSLHIWETDSDIDNVLQLTQVIAKIRNPPSPSPSTSASDKKTLGTIILASSHPTRNNFARCCDLVKHLTGNNGKKHLEGTVYAFDTIVVVRGVDPASPPTGDAAKVVVDRINTCINRIFKMCRYSDAQRKLVWHHGPAFAFMLDWINSTTPDLRACLSALSLTGALDLVSGPAAKPSPEGRRNSLKDLARLEEYAAKLAVPVVWLDPKHQGIVFEHLATYMYFYAYYLPTFLPAPVLETHLHAAMDALVTFAARLRGAATSTYGAALVRDVQAHLDARVARPWAASCIDARSYDKASCRDAAKDASIHAAVHLADSPFQPFSQAIPAFARLAVGPAAGGGMACVAAPAVFDFSAGTVRASSAGVHRVLVSRGAGPEDVDKVTARVQGMMMGVLERVRTGRAEPKISEEFKESWKEVVCVVEWGMEGCKGRMPKGVEGKVGFVGEKVRAGTWGFVVGAKERERKDGAAATMNTGMQNWLGQWGQGHGHGQGQQQGGQGLWGAGIQIPQQQQQQQQQQQLSQSGAPRSWHAGSGASRDQGRSGGWFS